MRLAGRIAVLERHAEGDPALYRQWLDFLTRIRAMTGHQMDVPAAARYFASRGIPATLCDWLQHLAVIAADTEESDATDNPA